MPSLVTRTLSACFAASLILAGCAADSSDVEDSSDELSQAGIELTGSWKSVDANTLDSLVLLTDGHFIHDQFRNLNGVLVNNGAAAAPFGRDTGTFRANAQKKTVTLDVKDGWHAGEKQIYSFVHIVPILNGVLIPGATPTAQLSLTGPSPSVEKIDYKLVDSWCSIDTDCKSELSTKTWTPQGIQPTGVPQCNVKKNACVIAPPKGPTPGQEGGMCAGFAGIACQAGLVCTGVGNYPDAAGTCTKSQPGPGEEGGICGGFAGFQCKAGLVCTGVGNYPDAAGTCNKQSPAPGQEGGMCGGFAGIPCKTGLTCVYPKVVFPDVAGHCAK